MMGVSPAKPILKLGFSNHNLLQDMMDTSNATFVCYCGTRYYLPLVCRPYRMPFLLNLSGRGQQVSDELYAVSAVAVALAKMDELEGVSRGCHERLAIEIEEMEGIVVETYYEHQSYEEVMWRGSGEEGYNCYTEKVGRGYVKCKDWP